MKLSCLLLLLSAATACSGLRYEIDNDVFRDMPIDKKLRLFDAENDVSLAVDERAQVRARIREIKIEAKLASSEVDAAPELEDAADNASLDVLTSRMWQSRADYLEGSLDYLRKRLQLQDGLILLARAKFELAKALLVKKNKLAGVEDIEIKNFEEQIAAINQALQGEQGDLEGQKGNLERLRAAWLTLRNEVAASRLTGFMAPGEDELPVWESW